ncbi:MAG: DUF3575 domain-containing protein [Muribaculaceae bacterium]|nr:DUF3575 domain-containing protein [Muribaculaceae bacterium]
MNLHKHTAPEGGIFAQARKTRVSAGLLRGLLLCVLVLTSAATVAAVNAADSTTVYFRQGSRYFDPSLDGNRRAMDRFVEQVRDAAAAGDIDRIVVSGYASPEGLNAANERLARNRCEEVVKYIIKNTGVDASGIVSEAGGVAWARLRRLVAENPDVPRREKVLDIIDNTPVWVYNAQGRIVDGRKKQLMDLAGGRPYNWLLEHVFPQLRNAVAVSLYLKESTPSDLSDVSDRSDLSDQSDNAVEEVIAEEIPVMIEEEEEIIAPASRPKLRNFALKTNLLFDAALMPNLELQWQFNRHWSVAVEGDVAWWSRPSANKYYRLAVISPEVRYHIAPRGILHGMYAGVFGGGGWYQLANGKNDGKGNHGEGYMAGLSFGYMWPISRCLSLEAGVGAGFMHARNREYLPVGDHKLYLRTKSINYFGPLKLKLSLAWRFGINDKTYKVNSAL